MDHCNQPEHFQPTNANLRRNEQRTKWVVILTALTMVVEIVAGYLTGSMALLADGWHMASHAAALTLTLIVYRLARSNSLAAKLSFGTGKLMPLGGYTSAIGLGIVALFMGYESIARFIAPVAISFDEALIVAVIGLIINIVSALLLGNDHDHDHGHSHGHDHNHRAAYVHVIADALTSVAAIIALIVGKYQGLTWLDPLMGVAGALLILRWAWKLLQETAWELLDGHAKKVDFPALKNELENAGARVLDLHIWRIGPNSVSVQLVLESQHMKGAAFFRKIVAGRLPSAHIVVEERSSQKQ